MDASKINQIIDAWSAFLESAESKRLTRFFMAQIPESLLPYPKKEIEEALNTYIRHFEKIGKHEQAQIYLNAMAPLAEFVDDKEAIESAHERLARKT